MPYKQITPDVTEIKTGTPAIKVGDKYVVGGIGGNFIPGGGGGGGADVTLGQIDADGNFQPLVFDGQTASNDGDPEAVDSYYGWKGTLRVPDKGIRVIQGGDALYYKCASVDTGEPILQTPNDATSNNGSYYTISASSYYGSGYDPYLAFAGKDKWWYSAYGVSSAYLQIQFTEPKSVNRLHLKASLQSENQVFTTLSLLGSNDGESWTVIYEATSDKASVEVIFDFDTVSYTHYRVNAINSGCNYIGVQKFELYYKNESSKKTWTGYLAVLGDDGTYTFEETATTGLTYGTAYTPLVDKIYNTDATIIVTKLWDGELMPTDSLAFYAPLTEEKATAETGQSLTTTGSITYSNIEGIDCAYFDGSSYIESPDNGIFAGATARTLSLWFYPLAIEGSTKYMLSYGTYSDLNYCAICHVANVRFIFSGEGNSSTGDIVTANKWYHAACVYTGSTAKIYLNGDLMRAKDLIPNTILSGIVYIGRRHDGTNNNFAGYLSACRIYNRALTEGEIKLLATEFTPTA